MLQLPSSSAEFLREILPRLHIKIDVLTVSNVLHTQDGRTSDVMGPTSEVVYSDFVKETDDPLVVVHDAVGENDYGKVFAFWKLDVILRTETGQ